MHPTDPLYTACDNNLVSYFVYVTVEASRCRGAARSVHLLSRKLENNLCVPAYGSRFLPHTAPALASRPSKRAARCRLRWIHQENGCRPFQGCVDIDQGDPEGWTPLVYAAKDNRWRVVKVLLENGADLSVVADECYTALIIGAQAGHVTVVKLLVEAGADKEQKDSQGHTPLHPSSHRGHSEVMEVLLEAGAKVESRLPDGSTSLYPACEEGHRQAVGLLLDAKTNPLLAPANASGDLFYPLDVASQDGHSDLVWDMLEHVGIEGCGGQTDGVDALHYAAQDQRLDVMVLLTEVGVVDTGIGLLAAVGYGRAASIRFLSRQQEVRHQASGVRAYVNDTRDPQGQTPVYRGVLQSPQAAPRIIHCLIEVGADVAKPVPVLRSGEKRR